MIIAGIDLATQPLTIAEVGINHNGSVERALEMIGVASSCGVNAVKFQIFRAQDVCDEEQTYTYKSQGKQITEKRIEIFRRCELPRDAWPSLKEECDKQSVLFLSTPETIADLEFLLELGIPAIKIGSDNLMNYDLLRRCASSGLPTILSTGMAYRSEIVESAWKFYDGTAQLSPVILMVCTSEYPCPMEHANLARIPVLRYETENIPLGFSDHTRGSLAAFMAAGLGACVFEKHFTLDPNLPGPDHWWSATPKELANWVSMIHKGRVLLGSGVIEPTNREKAVRDQWRRKSGQKLREVA